MNARTTTPSKRWRPGMPLVFRAAGACSIGLHRQTQEDSALLSDSQRLYGVADGMGGHEHGEVASELTIVTIYNLFRKQAFLPDARNAKAHQLRRAVEEANARVFRAANGDIDDELRADLGDRLPSRPARGMGTTFCGMTYDETTGKVAVANVGDSRCYLLRGGALTQITEDHVPKTEFRSHMILRAVGTSPEVKVDVFLVDVVPGDVLLFCTDGVHGMLDDAAIQSILQHDESMADPHVAAHALVIAANEAGGQDNSTAMVVQVQAA